MEKQIFYDKNADKEILKFPLQIQKRFHSQINILGEIGKLEFPDSRKIDKNLYEIRIKFKGEYRGFYAYIRKAQIIVLHCFRKKSQKTPIKSIKTAKRRLKYYE